MQKWEYLYLEAHLQSAARPQATKANGQLLEDRPNLWEYINKLGDEGWELVNVYNYAEPSRHKDYFVFKRPRE